MNMIGLPLFMVRRRPHGERGHTHGKRGRQPRTEPSQNAPADLAVGRRFTPADRVGWIRLGIFAVVVTVLAVRIVTLGMAEFYVLAGNEKAVSRALAWNATYPAALTGQGSLLVDTDPTQAEVLLIAAIRGNPADASAYLALAKASEAQEYDKTNGAERSRATSNAERARKLVAMAVALAPRREDVQLKAADFWMRQERPDNALRHWGEALHVRPQLGDTLYPVMLRLAQNPAMWPAFSGALANGRRWWTSFIRYVAANSENTETLRALYHLREQGGVVAEAEERQAFLARLQREGRWLDAYFAWLNSLGPQQLAMLGHLYNGSFELPIGNEGFDWHAPKIQGVVVETVPTYGSTGARALHVVFQGGRVRFQHVYQFLLLDPGRYRFQGRARPDSLETEKGLQWTVRCAAGGEPLATSERFLGSDQWRHFGAEFAVPSEGCEAQVLRLELAGQLEFELQAKGAAWFDDLTILWLDDVRTAEYADKVPLTVEQLEGGKP